MTDDALLILIAAVWFGLGYLLGLTVAEERARKDRSAP